MPGERAPVMKIAHGSSLAPTMMCAVPGGQWKKSHWRSRRSSPSTIEDALAGEDEEALLVGLGVVAAGGVAGPQDMDADPVLLRDALRLPGGPRPAAGHRVEGHRRAR